MEPKGIEAKMLPDFVRIDIMIAMKCDIVVRNRDGIKLSFIVSMFISWQDRRRSL